MGISNILEYFSNKFVGKHVEEASEQPIDNRRQQNRIKTIATKKKKANNPPTAYSLFLQDRRDAILNKKVDWKTFARESSEEWRAMSDDERSVYLTKANQIRHQMKHLYGTPQRRGKKSDGVKKRVGPYWKYANEKRAEVTQSLKDSGVSRPQMKNVNVVIAQQWRALPADEKNRYRSTAN